MPNIIKLLKGLQLNHESIKQIEEVSAWLAQTLSQTVVTNSQTIATGGKE